MDKLQEQMALLYVLPSKTPSIDPMVDGCLSRFRSKICLEDQLNKIFHQRHIISVIFYMILSYILNTAVMMKLFFPNLFVGDKVR